MLMFPTPGQIFLAHLGTSINMATWQGACKSAAQSESAPHPKHQQGNQRLLLLLRGESLSGCLSGSLLLDIFNFKNPELVQITKLTTVSFLPVTMDDV